MSDLLGVGDEVMCIDANKSEGWSSLIFPEWVQKDNKYIVRELLNNDDIVVGVLLNELENPNVFQKLLGRHQESAFATWRFSKLRSNYEINEAQESERIEETEVLTLDPEQKSQYKQKLNALKDKYSAV